VAKVVPSAFLDGGLTLDTAADFHAIQPTNALAVDQAKSVRKRSR
jgi:hypothetical protein